MHIVPRLRRSHRRRVPRASAQDQSKLSTIKPLQELEPLAVSLQRDSAPINPQRQSPLFNTLPAEIRSQIFGHCFILDEDSTRPYDACKRYTRPDQSAHPYISLSLLLSCRAIYIETYLLPCLSNPLRVFDGDVQDYPPHSMLKGRPYPTVFANEICLQPWQFAVIDSVELTVQQTMLEGGTLERTSKMVGAQKRHEGVVFEGFAQTGYPTWGDDCRLGDDSNTTTGGTIPQPKWRLKTPREFCRARQITHLTLRMNRTDWWSWTDDPLSEDLEKRLRLEPLINFTGSNASARAMAKGLAARTKGKLPNFRLDSFEIHGRWGEHIREFWPDLQRLELVLESFAQKEAQLDNVVAAAKLWTFPVEDGWTLKWDGEVQSMDWQGVALYGYEPQVTWVVNRESQEEERPVRSWLRRVTSVEKQALDGQRFVVRRMVYVRKKATTEEEEDSD